LHRLGGLARQPRVRETPADCAVTLPGADGVEVQVRVEVPPESAAGWRYADPDGKQHDVVNCSVAALELLVSERGRAPRTLCTSHGGAYELGMRERDHGVPIAPFPDG
jgi:hypothetical protein